MTTLRDALLSLVDYDAWATHRVLDAAAPLTPEQLATRAGAPDRSVHQLLVHLNGTYAFWQATLEGTTPPRASDADLSGVAAIRAWSDGVRATFRAFVAGLSDADLDRTISGRGVTRSWWEILVQCLQHAIHHRGEVASLLTEQGHSPGDLDYVLSLRERDAAG